MAETRSIASVLEAAEQAAAAGDYPSAGRLLREAATLQEATLGPQHPDLANTLNNLGIVCEVTNEPAEAERSYRRAYEIASLALPADHPFVATSLKNLNDFHAAKGFQTEAAVDTTAARVPVIETPPPAIPLDAPVSATGDSTPAATASFPRWAIAVIALAAIALAAYFVTRRPAPPAEPHAPGSSATPTPESNVAEVSRPTPPAETPPAASVTQPTRPGRGSSSAPARASAPVPPPPASRAAPVPAPFPSASANRETKSSDASLSIVDAQLCRDLNTGGGEWKCARAEGTVAPGRFFFYTRIKSPTDTVVEVRWYQGDKLRHTGELRISANPSAGYRTYSRFTIDARSTGSWRVEVRAKDGRVLRETRFDVR